MKTNRKLFVDANNSATSGDNTNRHIEYVVFVLNLHQPLWFLNIHLTQPPLSNNQSTKPKEAT